MRFLPQTNAQYGVKFCSLLLTTLLFAEMAHARPKIGLALGGGGAKGAVHIGVLRALEQHNIPIDYIAGTSIGSVVGGMYATGLTVDEIEKIMLATPWAEGYSDRIPRESLPWRTKQQSDQFNIPLELGIKNDRLNIPSGLLYGQGATKLLRAAMGEHPNFDSFDELAIPYRATATDLANYKAIVINKGSLIMAMRASSSVPGALAPEEVNGLLLVDGGITKNLPVDVVRNMGADIIIAVDIGKELLHKDALGNTFAVMEQMTSFLTSSNAILQRELLTQQDILIKPNIDGLSTTDWSFLEEAIMRGEAAANRQSPQLVALSLDDESYREYLSHVQAGRQRLLSRLEKPVSKIKLNKKSQVSDDLILDRLNLPVGEEINALQINAAVDRLFAINEFQRVDAFTQLDDDGKVLQVVAEEKAWGPNFLQFGIGWENDFNNNSDLSFDMAYTLGNLTKNGGEWRSELEMGSRPSFDTELYLPLDSRRDFYSSSRYIFSAFEWDLYVENAPLVPIEQQYNSISQGLGYNFVQQGFAELGLTSDLGVFSDPILLNGSINYFTYGGYLKFGFDTLDSIDFPTEGSYLTLSAFLRDEEVDDHMVITKEEGVSKIRSLVVDMNWKGALKFGNHAVVAKASYAEAFTENDNESIYIAYLGGFLNLSGYGKDTLAGAKKSFVAGIYQFDLGKSLLHLAQFPLYLGLSLETGNAWQQDEEIDPHDLIVSGSAYLGTDTALGPIALGYGRTNSNEQAFYFYLGKSF
jgi:NTE family protein